MKLSLKNIWITINILLAATMVYFVITAGVSNPTTLLLIGITNLSALLFFFYNKKMANK